MSMKKKNLDVYLAEIFKQFIAIKDDDLKTAQEVFKSVFEEVKLKMGEKCNYFSKYSSQIMYAGSVYDGIKVSRMDEFDMDIVIRLPINYDLGITLENDAPGFLKMKITDYFDNLDKQPEWEKCHKVTREWRDADKYFLQNKFRHWLHGIVQKALNEMNGQVTVNGTTYLLRYKESGPAYTLNISNVKDGNEFNLDVDLVPVIRFMLPRWPEGYRNIEGSQIKEWLVVPKPNKGLEATLRNRCWRLSFQDYEKEMMKGCQQLKTTIRLIKKLRDALDMKAIASYYIKTLFLWKINKTNDKKFWQNKLSVTFRIMVQEFIEALEKKRIPYFWHEENNLIEGLKPTLQKLYLEKLRTVLKSIDASDVDAVAAALLTPNELAQFKSSEVYQKQPSKDVKDSPATPLSANVSKQPNIPLVPPYVTKLEGIVKKMIEKSEYLEDKLCALEDRMERLEKTVNLNSNGCDLSQVRSDLAGLSLDASRLKYDLKEASNSSDLPITDSLIDLI